jgi:hypothetical protein
MAKSVSIVDSAPYFGSSSRHRALCVYARWPGYVLSNTMLERFDVERNSVPF